MNGYSGFFSDRYNRVGQVMLSFPDQGAINLMKSLGVRYLTVHGEFMTARDYSRLTTALDRMAPTFRLVSRHPWKDAEISLYRVETRPR